MRTIGSMIRATGAVTAALLPAALASVATAWAAPVPALGPAPQPARIVADLHGPDAPGAWDYAAIDASSGRALVARMTGVQAIALDGNRPQPQLAAGRHVHAVVPLPGHRLLFTNGDSDTATLVESGTGAILATLATGAKPDGAVFDAASNQVLVMNGDDSTITRIDVGTAVPRVVGTIAVGGGLEAPASDGHGRLFVNIKDRNQVAVVSLASGQVTARYALSGCQGPTGLAYDPTHRLLVSACANGVATLLQEDGTERATLAIGPHPDAVIADPAHDRVFIPSGGLRDGDGTLSEITLAGSPHVTRVLTTRSGARTGAYDPGNGRLYLPYGQAIRTKGQPPKLAPGSFGVLVLDMR